MLNAPSASVAVGSNVFVGGADYLAQVTTPGAVVTIVTGIPGSPGCTNGAPGTATFSPTVAMTADATYLYTLSAACGLRKTALTGFSTSSITLTGSATSLTSVVAPGDGSLYGTNGGGSNAPNVYKINPSTGVVTTLLTLPGGCGGGQGFGLVSDGTNLFVQEQDLDCGLFAASKYLYKVVLATLAVSSVVLDNRLVMQSGMAAQNGFVYARMDVPGCGAQGCFANPEYGPRVAQISTTTGAVTVLAGSSSPGYADGTGTDSWFAAAAGIAGDGTNVYVADTANNRLRKIAPGSAWAVGQQPWVNSAMGITLGDVRTLAGNATPTSVAGTGTAAGFNTPTSVTVVKGTIYVGTADTIMKVDPATQVATIVAGVPGSPGNTDAASGSAARVSGPTDMVNDGHDVFFDQSGTIRRLTVSTGAVSTFGPTASHLTIGPDGFLYTLDPSSGHINRMDPVTGATTLLTTVVGGGCGGGTSYGLSADATTIWVATADLDCGGYPGKPFLRYYSISTGAHLGDHGITDTRNINYAQAGVAVASVGGQVYVAYAGYNNTSFADNYCWPVEIFAVNKATGVTSAVAGPAPTLGNDANTVGCAFPDADGVGLAAQFSGVTQLASDGIDLYTVGANATNNRLRVINPAPVATNQGGPNLPLEGAGGCACASHNDYRRTGLHPVDFGSGTLFENSTDLALPGRGPAIGFTRTFDSGRAAIAGRLGYGWTDSYDWLLTVGGSGQVTVRQANGSQTLFAPSGSTYVAASRVLATLVHNGDGTWTYTVRGTQIYTFNSSGKLTKITDLNGYHTNLAYDGSGRLSTITDPGGRVVTLNYDASNRIHTMTDTLPQTVTYNYDGAGNLQTVVDLDGRTWTYGYDTSHRLTTDQDPRLHTTTTNYDPTSGLVSWQSDRRGKKTTLTYTPATPGGYTTTLVAHPKGNQDLYVYYQGLNVKTTYGYGSPLAVTWTYTYDPATLALTQTVDPNGHTSSATYDAAGNKLTSTDGNGHTTTWTYNGFNEPLTMQDALGVTTTYGYDASGNLKTTSTPLVGSMPLVNQVATNVYGDSGHPGDVTTVTDPDGKNTVNTYDTYGDALSTTDPTGLKTSYTYNLVGWKLTEVTPAGNATGGVPSQHTITYSNFTGFGKPKTVTDQLGHATTYGYDADQNLTDVTDADTRLTHTDYNENNQPILVTRPGSVTQAPATTTTATCPPRPTG